jgi:hypothetical protein
MWNLHYIKKGGLCEVHGPRLRDDFHLLSLCLGQILVRCEHAIALTVSQVIVTNLQGWNPLYLWSDYAYPLREIHIDDGVVEVPRDTIATHYTSQGWDVIG